MGYSVGVVHLCHAAEFSACNSSVIRPKNFTTWAGKILRIVEIINFTLVPRRFQWLGNPALNSYMLGRTSLAQSDWR